ASSLFNRRAAVDSWILSAEHGRKGITASGRISSSCADTADVPDEIAERHFVTYPAGAIPSQERARPAHCITRCRANHESRNTGPPRHLTQPDTELSSRMALLEWGS